MQEIDEFTLVSSHVVAISLCSRYCEAATDDVLQ